MSGNKNFCAFPVPEIAALETLLGALLVVLTDVVVNFSVVVFGDEVVDGASFGGD